MTTEPKNKGGRPRKPDAERFEQRSVRLTPAQWAKVDANGGQAWIRQLVEGADDQAGAQRLGKTARPSSPMK